MLEVTMLLTDGYGGFGGIAKFNRDLLEALDGCALIRRIWCFPRVIPDKISGRLPENVVYNRRAAVGKLTYVREVILHALVPGAARHLVICGHLHLLPLAWLVARHKRATLALVIHGIDSWTPSVHFLANNLAGRVDAVLSVSEYSARLFSAWSKVAEKKTTILPNTVSLDDFRPAKRDQSLAERYGIGPGRKVLITLGRMAKEERYKGFDEVLEAMPKILRSIPDVLYVAAGDGPDRARLEAKARSLGIIKHVVFPGRILEEEKTAHYNLADVYVMPSSGEGFGIVLLEAAACGVPVIGSAVDGSAEALLGGKLGHLVDPRDIEGLAVSIIDALREKSRRVRPDGIETFSTTAFRRRVFSWIEQMHTETT